jgi:hypothetical protein
MRPRPPYKNTDYSSCDNSGQDGSKEGFSPFTYSKYDVRTKARFNTSYLWSSLRRSEQDVVLQLQSSLFITLYRLELDDERVLDRKDGVVVQIFGLCVEDLSCNRFITLSNDL